MQLRVSRRRVSLALAFVALVSVPTGARQWFSRAPAPTAVAYDGTFTLARLWYARYAGWSYDWPEMEQNLYAILKSITAIPINSRGGTIVRMDDPELFKYPVAYLSEPGYWLPSAAEATGLRQYLQKGGFLIVDDFHYESEWSVFEAAMRRVLPDAAIERLTLAHPVFNNFFGIRSLDIPYPGSLGQRGLMGEFYGIYERNDPSRRLMVVINYNMDIGDYMEHSGEGMYMVAPTNEAYKLGINYLVYGLSR